MRVYKKYRTLFKARHNKLGLSYQASYQTPTNCMPSKTYAVQQTSKLVTIFLWLYPLAHHPNSPLGTTVRRPAFPKPLFQLQHQPSNRLAAPLQHKKRHGWRRRIFNKFLIPPLRLRPNPRCQTIGCHNKFLVDGPTTSSPLIYLFLSASYNATLMMIKERCSSAGGREGVINFKRD